MIIIIDNGHGGVKDDGTPITPGKRSVDGGHIEGVWAREIAGRIVAELKVRGYDARLLTPEQQDISISSRVRRVNRICAQYGAGNVLLISVHNNARGNGQCWYDETMGLSAMVSLNAGDNSKGLADLIFQQASRVWKPGVRRPDRTHNYWQQNLGICRDSRCPAVLVEYGFMTSRTELEWIDSADGKAAAVCLTVEAISEYARNHDR